MHLVGPALIAFALAAAPALASQQGVATMQSWKQADKCAKEAQTAFPDFTAEANAKRDANLKNCLATRHLPPRDLDPPR